MGTLSNSTYLGIDISKATLDVAGPGIRMKVANDRTGLREIVKATRHLRRRQFVFEPTGHYGRLLEEYLRARRMRLTIADSFRVRQFARATGRIAKTDPIDAAVLASYGSTLRVPVSPALENYYPPLIELVRVRRQLEQHLRSLDLQREAHRLKANIEGFAAVKAVLRQEIKACGARIEGHIKATPRLAELSRRLRLVIGIRQRASESLIADLPELGRINRKQIAALAGLAPYNRDSGVVTTTTSRHIQRGRSAARATLYMCALVASAHNPILRAYYQRLIGAGKPRKVALVAVARKLLVYINHLTSDTYTGRLPVQGRPRRVGSFWTNEEREQMHLLRKAGASCKAIALELGRKESGVQKQLYSEKLRESGKQKRRRWITPVVPDFVG